MNKARVNKKGRRLTRILLICIVLVLLFCAAVNAVVIFKSKPYIIDSKQASKADADCILVLGALVWKNGSLSLMLEDRVLEGIALYKDGVSDRILMSGDHGRKDYDEVNHMKEYAVEKGVPADDIFMDHAGFSTYESMYRAKEIFEAKKIIIVTQGYHLYRAVYEARALGLDAYGVASDPREYPNMAYNQAREILARIKGFAQVIIHPKPTYLGDVIPISGSGSLTDD